MDGISRSQPPGQNRVNYEARNRDCPGALTPHCCLQGSVLGCSDVPLTTRTVLVCAISHERCCSVRECDISSSGEDDLENNLDKQFQLGR